MSAVATTINNAAYAERVARREIDDAMPVMAEMLADRLGRDCYGRRVIPISSLRAIKVALRSFNWTTGKWS